MNNNYFARPKLICLITAGILALHGGLRAEDQLSNPDLERQNSAISSDFANEPWWYDLTSVVGPVQKLLKEARASQGKEKIRALSIARNLDPLNVDVLSELSMSLARTSKEKAEVDAVLSRIRSSQMKNSDAIFYYSEGRVSPLFADGDYASLMDEKVAKQFVYKHFAAGAKYYLHQYGKEMIPVMVQRGTQPEHINFEGCYTVVTASVRMLDNGNPPKGTGIVTNTSIHKSKVERTPSDMESKQLKILALDLFKQEITNGAKITQQNVLIADLDGNGNDDFIAAYVINDVESGPSSRYSSLMAAEYLDGKLVSRLIKTDGNFGNRAHIYHVRDHFDLDNNGDDEVIIYASEPDLAGIDYLKKIGDTWEYVSTNTSWGGC